MLSGHCQFWKWNWVKKIGYWWIAIFLGIGVLIYLLKSGGSDNSSLSFAPNVPTDE